ncbi:MAG: PH domain-containing protein [Candidatus Brocadiia bacterium]|nr:MAG: PH domain-containing protein [Candidatus Brocadiia bacterium]
MTRINLKTKLCPFCAEAIQAEAVKCRFCNEFLNTEKARAVQAQANGETKPSDKVLFWARPSFWAMAGSIVRGLIAWAVAGFLMFYPVEKLLKLAAPQDGLVHNGRIVLGLGLAIIVLILLVFKTLRLKMTCYEVTSDRIEWSRGLLDRKVDNLDMFRIVDLKLRRSMLDCLAGVGTVVLATNDKSDPEFEFEKIRDCRKLYDIIKKSSLDADQKRGVIHLE